MMSTGLKTGIRVRVKAGTQAPDLPDFEIGGWTGTITQVSGKKDKQRFFLEWDEETVSAMSDEYRRACEDQKLYYLMACLTPEELEPIDADEG